MKIYRVLKKECFGKLESCFTSHEEIEEFDLAMRMMGDEMHFLTMLRMRAKIDGKREALMKQYATMVLFYREYFELLRNIISVLEFEEMTEDQIKQMEEDEIS